MPINRIISKTALPAKAVSREIIPNTVDNPERMNLYRVNEGKYFSCSLEWSALRFRCRSNTTRRNKWWHISRMELQEWTVRRVRWNQAGRDVETYRCYAEESLRTETSIGEVVWLRSHRWAGDHSLHDHTLSMEQRSNLILLIKTDIIVLGWPKVCSGFSKTTYSKTLKECIWPTQYIKVTLGSRFYWWLCEL